ncbi:MAG: hypothetical protein DRJ05_20530 [Bacteroidetes bacterium]|nr:MAG: hypothetical protein DRJ05_20530 [Bacteroidota bacterium]
MKYFKQLQVGSYSIGGPIGANPTSLFGTIFFEGQDLLIDSEEGLFDENKARKQINEGIKVCHDLSVPIFLDVVADTENAIEKQIDFVAKEFDIPFLVDGSDSDVRMKGLEIASNHLALQKTVYNSINADSTNEELDLINELKPAAIVVSAINTANYGVDSALEIVTQIKKKLVPDLHEKLLLDIGFLDEVSAKMSCKIGQELRSITGLPVGGAPCNGLNMWEYLKSRGEKDFIVSLASTLGFCTAFGLDFLFAGPLRYIKHVAPGQGAVDIYNRYNLVVNNRDLSLSENHPMQSMFKMD